MAGRLPGAGGDHEHRPRPVNGWALAWTFPGDQKITQLWNGSYTQSGEAVRVTNASYNPSIPPGGTVTVGFTGSFTRNDTSPPAFTLNRRACGQRRHPGP